MAGLGYYAEEFADIQRMPVPDNFSYVIPVEDDPVHTADNPFCWDSACDCHEDESAITQVGYHVQDGLMTPDEATDFVAGKQV